MILGIDTSTAIAGLALYDGAVSGEITWRSGRGHSVELMAQLRGLMRLRKVEPAGLSAVVVAIGPGSFTGVRVGLSAGKGLCLALGIPMIGVCTLDILAEAHADSCLPVRPLLDAGRKRFATALYLKDGDGMRRATSIEGRTLPEIVDAASQPTLLCGDVTAQAVESLGGLERGLEVAGPASSLRRAGFLAEIGWRRFQAGQVEDPALVDAVYLAAGG